MNEASEIKLYLPYGDANRFRTGEISNWSGKALAAPRTDLDVLLGRDELDGSGVYFLFGTDPVAGDSLAYIGEAEIIRDRLKQQRAKDFWVSAVLFVSKDHNLTKGHVRYLEGRLIEMATKTGRYRLENSNATVSRLPESDTAAMEVFLSRIQQMLPVLGSDILTPITGSAKPETKAEVLFCKNKNALAKGRPTEKGFVVFTGSTAVVEERRSAKNRHPSYVALRNRLAESGVLVASGGLYTFTRDTEFSSPSAAAAVIHGGGANGLIAWKDETGRTLKQIEQG